MRGFKKRTFGYGRRIAASLLALSVLLTGFTVSAAEEDTSSETLRIGIDGYAAEDGELKIYVNHNQAESFMITPDYSDVVFGNNQMVTDRITSFADTGEPVTYLCIVDVSGSMSQDRIDQAKDVIKDLADIKKPDDKIAITAMGNELTQSEFMTDSNTIKSAADVLTLTHEDTNLYYAIKEEINDLKTADDATPKKCLIIFSDGADDQDTGIPGQEAENEVTSSHIPVFTIGLLKNAGSDKDKEMAKILGSFARISSGGMHFAPALGDGDIETIADVIVSRINSSFVLYESLEDVKVSGQEVALKVSVSSQFGQTATDTITLPESDVKRIQEEIERITPVEEPVVEEFIPTITYTSNGDGTHTVSSDAEGATDYIEDCTYNDENTCTLCGYVKPKTILGLEPVYFYSLCGLLALLLALLIFMLIKRSRDKEEVVEEEPEETEDFPPVALAPVIPNESVTRPGEALGVPVGSVTMPVVNNTPVNDASINAQMVRMGRGEEKVFKMSIGETPYTLGRSAAKSKLAFADDTALSGVHCSLFARGKRVFIKDEQSTNGTFVNGVPISGQFELSQDDTILIGSYEYRISWK